MTGINIPIELYAELAKEYSNIIGAKVTYDSIAYIRRLIHEVKSIRKDFSVLVGFDDYLLPALMMGGDGGVMALANVAPQIHVATYNAWVKGDLYKAYEGFKKILKLVQIYDIATSIPAAIKASLEIIGAPIKPCVRPPLRPELPEIRMKIESIIKRLDLKIVY